ncbi:MAG: AMP-binding protein [Rubrivivax sp.]|nr:AMP-binding protein [Rubrivivax sp.]
MTVRPPDVAHSLLHDGLHWQVPQRLNIAQLCCTRWARDPRAAGLSAVLWAHEDGREGRLSYADLQRQADRLSHALARLHVQRGDRVAIVMPQRPETAIAHIALQQLGAVVVPLSMLFGPEALAWRLQDSGAVAVLAHDSAITNLRAVIADCPALRWLVTVGAASPARAESAAGTASTASTAERPAPAQREIDWDTALAAASRKPFVAADTRSDDAAVLIYTSGTTGPPKGALIPQRALIGNLSGFVCSQNWFGAGNPADSDEVLWSPADWAWTGGLMDALLPTLYFGRPIVAFQGRFSPERAFELMQRWRVTHSFLFPTALKAMMKAVPEPAMRYTLALRSVMSAGEALGDTVFHWCRQALGITVNEMFGQTEINYIVGNCGSYIGVDGSRHAGWPARPGSMGRAYPGHRVAVIDDSGAECPCGTPGDVSVHRLDMHGQPDPVFFLGYWRNDAATAAKYTADPANSWCRTGDTAVMDADGYLWYQGRSDDVFKAAGYRIGPSEIENCLLRHPAVANAAVVPKPDAERGAVVKAYVVLASGHKPSEALVKALQAHVRGRLAPYEYPKEIEFIDALPMTTTGKVQRRVLRLQEEQRAQAAART